MSAFKNMLLADVSKTFLNLNEFAEKRTIVIDDIIYKNIPVVMSGIKEKDRKQLVSDHVQGLYLVTSILHCSMADLGNNQPEKGQRIKINDGENESDFYREFYVASSVCEMGMLRIELEAIDE